MKKRLKIKIHGKVQGVFFRYNALQKAQELNLAGFVKNEDDGTVYVEVQGSEKDLNKFLEWCREGPLGSEVAGMESQFSDGLKQYDSFKIVY